MRYIVHLVLLLTLCASPAFASDTQLVELIVFRQGGDSLPSSAIAPDLWADNATRVSRDMQRTTQLDYLARKLTADDGYQVLMHQSWLQHSSDAQATVAIKAGEAHFNHYPIEGTLAFKLARNNKVEFDLWLNQFNADKTLRSSERFTHRATVANDQVTFIDHYPFGALMRIQRQNTQAPKRTNTTNTTNHAAEFE